MSIIQNLEDTISESDGHIAINRTRCGKLTTCVIRQYAKDSPGRGLYGLGSSLAQTIENALRSPPLIIPPGPSTLLGKTLEDD